MDLAVKIAECQTIAELSTLERLYLLNEVEQRILFGRKFEFFRRVTEWRVENEQLGLTADFTDTWTPENEVKDSCVNGKTMTPCYKWAVARNDHSRTMALIYQ
jgi:hypothetical protein